MTYPPAVVMPTDRPAALGIARSLGGRGVRVYGVDADRWAMGMASRYIIPCLLPNADDSEENRLRCLMELGRSLGEKAVLFPLSDDDVMLCSRERDELQKHYVYVMPEHSTVTGLLTKDGLHSVAQACDVPAPQMFLPRTRGDVEALAAGLPYPVILKPAFSPSWLRPEILSMLRDHPLSSPPKVAVCRSAQELLRNYQVIAAYDDRMIIQEIIPGEDERLAYFCFYLDRQSKPLAMFAGRKLRVLPVGFGSASYVRSFHDPQLEEVSLRLLDGVRYQGLGGIEFKKDPRDERYKLIEFNARFGMWDALSVKCGIDIPYLAYCDALEWPVEAQHDYRDGVIWLDLQRDIRAFLILRRRRKLSFGKWLMSLRGDKYWAVYSRRDWRPALMAAKDMLKRPANSIARRLGLAKEAPAPGVGQAH